VSRVDKLLRPARILLAARGQQGEAVIVDLLTDAIAEHHGAVMTHYDTDFEHIAAVTGQLHRWIVPRGAFLDVRRLTHLGARRHGDFAGGAAAAESS
jgi:hypothetical protein